ncbi:MAG TPA: hypothetical protein VGG34_08150 [Opitutaceae bacterium]|jgi:hypothetical protein
MGRLPGISERAARIGRSLSLFVMSASAVMAVNVGDSMEKVIAEKGRPRSTIDAGSVKILSYTDVVIKVRDDLVVSIRPAAAAPKAAAPAPPPAVAVPQGPAPLVPPAAGIDEVKAMLDQAVARVVEIVNQEVPHEERGSRQAPEWHYHDGAERPDFAHVDVRAFQELRPADPALITWRGHDDWVWNSSDLEFNSKLKYFYRDRTLPTKRLTQEEMVEINAEYRRIAACEARLAQLGYSGTVP